MGARPLRVNPAGTWNQVVSRATEGWWDAGYSRVRREWRGPAWLGVEQRSCLAAA